MPPSLHWSSALLTAFHEPGAIQQAKNSTKKILLDMKLQNVKIQTSDVIGNTSDTMVAVAFVQLDSKRTMPIVMSTGPSAGKFCNDYIKRIKMVVRID